MATNAGIEVTQLRPQAQTRDNYVRPQGTNSGIQQGLARLAGNIDKKQTAEAKARAEEIHIQDSLNSASNLHNFDAFTQESPAVIAHLKELRGRSYANQWRMQVENDYNEWRMGSKEDGMDFQGFMAERKTTLADTLKGDRFLTAGALGVINETEYNMRQTHRSFLDQRMRNNVVEELGNNIQVYMTSMKSGDLRIGDVARQVDDAVQLTHETGGLERTKGNKLMFQKAIDMYTSTGDEDYYFLAKNLRYAKGKGNTVGRPEALDILDRAKRTVDDRSVRQQAQQQAASKKQADLAKASSMDDVYAALLTGEDSEEAMLAAISNGNNATTVKANVDAFLSLKAGDREQRDDQTTYGGALLAAIHNSTGNPRGIAVTREDIANGVANGTLHTEQVDSLLKALHSAEKAQPILLNGLVQNHRRTMVAELENSKLYASPSFAKKVGNLKRDYDLAFTKLIDTHYVNGGTDPTDMELMQYTTQAEVQITQSTKALQDQKADFDAHLEEIDKAALKSASSTEYLSNDPEKDNLEAFITQDDRASVLIQMLKEDPFIEYEEGVMAWQALDIIVGAGAFNHWWELNANAYGSNR